MSQGKEDPTTGPAVVIEPRGLASVTSSGNAIAAIVLPTETGVSGTQTLASVDAEAIEADAGAAFGEQPLLALIARAGRDGTTITIADLASVLAARSLDDAKARANSDRRREEELRSLRDACDRRGVELADARVQIAVLDTERRSGANPPMAISGAAVLTLGGLIVSLGTAPMVQVFGAAVTLVGVFQTLWAVLASRWFR